MTREEKRALIYKAEDMGATLDGEPCAVRGAMLQFAVVSRMDGKGGSVEFAWETVRHILNECEGKFKSR